jgi:putative SOS response-associated peptidase YedK
MCGRFALGIPRKKLAGHFGLDELPEAPARYNIAPTQLVEAVVAGQGGRREARLLRWGLIPAFAQDPAVGSRLINARAETLAGKPSFRAAFKYRRCLVMAQAFYEWAKVPGGKQPYAFVLKGGLPMGLAGLWEAWRGPSGTEVESCTIVTCAANALVAGIHERMPAIVAPASYGLWLGHGPGGDGEELAGLLVPYPAGEMAAYPVSRLLNNPAHDGPECLDRLE